MALTNPIQLTFALQVALRFDSSDIGSRPTFGSRCTLSGLIKNSQTDDDLGTTEKEGPMWAARNRILTSAPGVGRVVSFTLLVELPELGSLNRKEIATLAGVEPLNRDRGAFRGKRIVWGGRARVRQALYMATLAATRHNPIIRDFYHKLGCR